MYSLDLRKPDGRSMTLYSRNPIPANIQARSPRLEPVNPDPHLRWHPLRQEWVAYAAYRQTRTFQPPPQYNPLLATDDPRNPTELPAGEYDIAVFDNLFPALSIASPTPPASIVPTAPAAGHCEVVVFTQDASASLGSLPVDQIALLIEVWAARTTAIMARAPHVQYILPFENRGTEVGVTLHHPHGQIYAYPEVPPVPQRMHDAERAYHDENGASLLPSLVAEELRDGRRIIYSDDQAVAFVPAWARYPYEVWISPRTHTPDFAALSHAAREGVARALLTVLRKYDRLWEMPFPYIMAWYQAPRLSGYAQACQLHAEIYPAYRMPGRLKYLAGTEIAAGLFANDSLPEDKAAELQAVQISLD